jgi:hypothetical protein
VLAPLRPGQNRPNTAIFAAVQRAHGIDAADLDEGVQKLLSVDSTSVRAHQHAAGARSDTRTGGTIE